MDNIVKFFGILISVIYFLTDSSVASSIEKPKECDKKVTRLRNGRVFIYSYTSTTESAFIGTTDARSGFKFTCNVIVHVPRKCESILEVANCHLYERQPGADEKYKESPQSHDFNVELSKHSVYFKHNQGEIIPDSLVVAEDESTLALNIKRGMLSAVQLKILEAAKYEGMQEQTDMFGVCPVRYTVPSDSADTYHTFTDITLCKVPQIFKLQKKPFSIIQAKYGGYMEADVSEPIYPFSSSVKCTYNINAKQRITLAECRQEQVFEPTAYNGSVYASAISSISQKLELKRVTKHRFRDVERTMRGRKSTGIKFEFDKKDEQGVTVAASDITNGVVSLARLYLDGHFGSVPHVYNILISAMRKADEAVLKSAMDNVWICHGNYTVNCDPLTQMMEKDYFLDGLLSCGTPNCLAVFSLRLKDKTFLNDPAMLYYFSYDLAVNHPSSKNVIEVMLDVCKSTKRVTCWLPLSIMVNRLFQDTAPDTWSEDDPVSKVLSHIRSELGNYCDPNEWKALTVRDQKIQEPRLILMLKVVGNIGNVIQDYDSDVKDATKAILPALLQCSGSTSHSYYVKKTAIQALEKMNITQDVEDALFKITDDFSAQLPLRTSAFLILAKEKKTNIIKRLIKLLYDDKMDNMRIYIDAYIQSILENDAPDQEEYRALWKNLIELNGRPLEALPVLMIGRSRYLELSRYFRFPLVATYYGVQMEMDMVYESSSPLVRSVVLKLNYYAGHKHNILELGIDVQGLEEVLDFAVGKKGAGLFKLFSIIAKAQELSKASNDGTSTKEELFGLFKNEVVDELSKLFSKVNYPQRSIPDGLLHWKVFGSEVFYSTVPDILQFLQLTNLKKSVMGIVETAVFHMNRGYHRIKTKSSKIVDLTKVLPTLSGAPLNMTVLLTSAQALELHTKFDIKKFVLRVGPFQAKSSGIYIGAVEFLGSMAMKLSSFTSCGCQMEASGQVANPMDTTVEFSTDKGMLPILKTNNLVVEMRNQKGKRTLGEAKSVLYLLRHNAVPEVIPADPMYEVLYEQCMNPGGLSFSFLTGNQVCVEARYPNVTTSDKHAYFPLSGPVQGKVFMKPGEKELPLMKLTADYRVKKMSDTMNVHRLDVNIAAKGEDLERDLEMYVSATKDWSEIQAGYTIPHQDVSFTMLVNNSKQYAGKTSEKNATLDISYYDKKQLTYEFKVESSYKRTKEELPDPKNNNEIRTGYARENYNHAIIKMPNLNLDMEFHGLNENLQSHIYTMFNWTYYCSKERPMLYLLHWDTEIAEKNGDTSQFMLRNDAVVNVSSNPPLWEAADSLTLSYPGQVINMKNDMQSNNSHAHRDTQVTYLNNKGEEKVVSMKADVVNETTEGDHHYCYVMKLAHSDGYEIDLDGHLSGSIILFSIQTDIVFNRKQKVDKKNAGLTSDQKQNDECEYGFFDIKTWDKKTWKIHVDLNGSPAMLFEPGFEHGGEIAYTLKASYPSCDKYAHVLSEGAVGQYMNNTNLYFRYWLRSNTNHSIGDTSDSKSTTSISKSTTIKALNLLSFNADVFYVRHDKFDAIAALDIFDSQNSFRNYNASYSISSRKESEGKGYIKIEAHQKSPWKLFTYDVEKRFDIDITSSSDIIATSKVSNVLVNNSDTSSLSYDNNTKELTIHSEGRSTGVFPALPWDIQYKVEIKMQKGKLVNIKVSYTSEDTGPTHFIEIIIVNPRELTLRFSHQKRRQGLQATSRNALIHHEEHPDQSSESAIGGKTSSDIEVGVTNTAENSEKKDGKDEEGEEVTEEMDWLMKLRGSTNLEHTLKWNPALGKKGLMQLTQKKDKVGDFLIDLGDTLTKNLDRKFGDKVIPILNMSVKSFYKDYIWIVTKHTPLPKFVMTKFGPEELLGTGKKNGQVASGLDQQESSGNIFTMLMKLEAYTIKTIGHYLKKPPGVFQPFIYNTLRPKVMKAVADSQITFMEPVLFKFESLLRKPKLTIGQRYFISALKYLREGKKKMVDPSAMLYKGQYITTFDNKQLEIPAAYLECTYLLAADFKDGKFALTTSPDGISLLTDQTIVNVDYNGRVFYGDCSDATNLPEQNKDGNVTVKSVDGVVDITTKYGIEISCDTKYQACRVDVLHSYRNRTLGLFGTIDFDKGTDMRVPDGHVIPRTDRFLSYFSIGGPSKCRTPGLNKPKNIKLCKSMMTVECLSMFSSRRSPLLTCHDKIQPGTYLDSCLDDSTYCQKDAKRYCAHVRSYLHWCEEVGFNSSKLLKAAKCESYPAVEYSPLQSTSPVDIVFVIKDEVFKGSSAEDMILTLAQHLGGSQLDTKVGILEYSSSSKAETAKTLSHFLLASDLNIETIQDVWRVKALSVNDALIDAVQYPFRFNSHKTVILLSTKQESLTSEEVENLVKMFKDKSTTFNLIGLYPELKTGRVIGINYDKSVILNKSQKSEIMPLPQSTLMKLIEETKGALLDLEPIIRGRKNRIQQITNHINQQTINNGLTCDL